MTRTSLPKRRLCHLAPLFSLYIFLIGPAMPVALAGPLWFRLADKHLSAGYQKMMSSTTVRLSTTTDWYR